MDKTPALPDSYPAAIFLYALGTLAAEKRGTDCWDGVIGMESPELHSTSGVARTARGGTPVTPAEVLIQWCAAQTRAFQRPSRRLGAMELAPSAGVFSSQHHLFLIIRFGHCSYSSFQEWAMQLSSVLKDNQYWAPTPDA
jgi:hypothetical protein